MNVDWSVLTQAQARRLVGPASRAEQAAAAKVNDGGDAEEAAWLVAFTLWEDLRVYAICGEKPAQPGTETK